MKITNIFLNVSPFLKFFEGRLDFIVKVCFNKKFHWRKSSHKKGGYVKKPAHEVIMGRIRKRAEEFCTSCDESSAIDATTSLDELIAVLSEMIIPPAKLVWVCNQLRQIKQCCISINAERADELDRIFDEPAPYIEQ